MEIKRATTKNDILAVMGDPKCFDTELFIGKYIETIMPIKKESIR